jgi:hypothetical protein
MTFEGLPLTLDRDEDLPNHATHFFQRTTNAEHLREKELNEKEDYQSSSDSPTRR